MLFVELTSFQEQEALHIFIFRVKNVLDQWHDWDRFEHIFECTIFLFQPWYSEMLKPVPATTQHDQNRKG